MTHSEITDLASRIRSHLSVLNSDQQGREQAVLLRKAAGRDLVCRMRGDFECQ